MTCATAAMPEPNSEYLVYPQELMEDVPDETRQMRVYESPGNSIGIPMIRISNKHLLAHNFNVGDRIEVCYQRSRIIIKKL